MKFQGTVILIAALAFSSQARAFDLGKEIGHCFHGGCDAIWSANQRIDDGIRSKSDSLVGPAKTAFDNSMRVLVDNRLNPLLDKLNGDLSARIDQASNRADQVLNDTQSGILTIIDHAGDIAAKTDGTVKAIIKQTFDDTDALERKVNFDVLNLIDDVDCKIDGSFEKLKAWLASLVTVPHPFEACYTDLGYVLSTPSNTDYVNWYRITQCEATKPTNKAE